MKDWKGNNREENDVEGKKVFMLSEEEEELWGEGMPKDPWNGGKTMTGREIVEWIEENHAEDKVVIAVDKGNRYLRVRSLWEGEADGGAVMMNVSEDEKPCM